MKPRSSLLILLFFVIYIAGCSNHSFNDLDDNGKIAKSHLEEKGYDVLSYQGKSTLSFSTSDLSVHHHMQLWSVQSIQPDHIIDKKIEVETFYVKDHPLENEYKSENYFLGKVGVNVWVYDGKSIGGISYPVIKKNTGLAGAPYSLDGRTTDEVQGDYDTWSREWLEKYEYH
ncbi:hypothetical protein ACLM5H_10845 [Fredinandcohnia humi]